MANGEGIASTSQEPGTRGQPPAKILPPAPGVLPPAEPFSKKARKRQSREMKKIAKENKNQQHMEELNALRTIPLDELDFETARKMQILASQINIKMDKPFKKRILELAKINKALVREKTLITAQPAMIANAKFNHIEDIGANERQYKLWPEEKRWKFYNDLRTIPLEDMTPVICHKIYVMAGILKIQLEQPFLQRRAELIARKRNKTSAVVPPPKAIIQPEVPPHQGSQIPVLPVAREPISNTGVPGMLNVLRSALFEAPPRNVSPFPSPFAPQPSFEPLPFAVNAPFSAQPGPSGLPWHTTSPSIPFHSPGPSIPMQVELGNRPLSTDSRNGTPHIRARSPSPRRRTRSPSPKRPRREHDETRPKTPTAKELAVTENYVLEPPKHKIEPVYRAPVTIQEMQNCSDMVFLCQFRDSTAITKPFLHPSSEMIVKRLARILGQGFELREAVFTSDPSADKRGRTRCEVSAWFNGIPRLVTLGEGVDPDMNYATNFAYASMMAALCYMMVIPYQLVQVVQNEGPEHIDLVLFSCKHRIREMIAVSREPVYGLLDAYNGGLTSIPQPVRDLWGIFINRMRHTGMEFWESNVIPVPSGVTFFTGSNIPNCHFTCARANDIFLDWVGFTPIHGEIVNFDIADYNNIFSCSRFFEFPAETGLVPPLSPPPCVESPHNYRLRFKGDLDVDINKFDPIVHLPFRDLLYRHGVGFRNTPRFSFFLLKYIGMRWKRALVLEHSLEIDVINGTERWKHVVKLSFEGVPYLFLGGKCRADSFPTALRHAGSVIAEQLANMMIIPRELCFFLEKEGKKWAAIIVYVCRHRFAAFEALVRNLMFASLHNVKTANLEIENPLYKLAESFFWRMRSVGFLYWVENHRNLLVPSSFGRVPKLPEGAFFRLVEHYRGEPQWDQINAAIGIVDDFHPSALKQEDRIWTVWEGGARFDIERSPVRESDIKEELKETGAPDMQGRRNAAASEVQKHQFEKALEDDFTIPLNALSNAECSAVFNLVRSLAATSKNKGLQMKTGRGPDPIGREGWRCDMSWSGKLSWILSSVYYSASERDLQFGAAWEMYKLLVLMGLFPPGLYKFIGNYEARLPCVVASLAPFLKLLESSLPTFMNHPDEENNRHLLLEHMRKLFVVEWQHRTIELPSELVPCIEEQKRLPFIRVDTMSDETEQLWRLSRPQFQRMAKIMDDRGRDLTQKTPRPEPGMKLGNLSAPRLTLPILPKKTPPKLVEPVKPPAKQMEEEEDDEDIDFDEELRQLEELCKSAVNKASRGPPGEDEYL